MTSVALSIRPLPYAIMQFSRRHGREFLFRKLLEPETEHNLREAIILEIFEMNDRISTSKLDISGIRNLTNKAIDRNCEPWIRHAKQLANQLRQDIELALQITKWNRNILEDALALIHFLRDCCGTLEALKAACEKRAGEILSLQIGPEKSYGDLAKILKDSRVRERNVLVRLLSHLSNCPSTRDYARDVVQAFESGVTEIPTATLRELFILNDAHEKSGEIWRQVDDMSQLLEQEKESPEKGENTPRVDGKAAIKIQELTEIVQKVFVSNGRTELQEVAKHKGWLSQCLVLVLDTEKRVMLTGGTQLVCRDSGLFSAASKTIKHQRISQKFTEVIKNCSKNFADHADDAKQSKQLKTKEGLSEFTDSQIEELYEDVVYKGKSDWYNSIPASTGTKPVLSWACDGYTFGLKPPCIRCQSLYPTWKLHEKPENVVEKKEALNNDLFSHLDLRSPSLDTEWAFCAETVAASKLYLLRNGTLALI